MKTLKLKGGDGLYTNLGLLLSEQCGHTIKAARKENKDKRAEKRLLALELRAAGTSAKMTAELTG